jgi:hypothetical protein
MERGEKDVFLFLSKGHQAWNLPLATKLGSSFASFPFFLKVQIWIVYFSLFGYDFQFESLKICSYNFP